MNVLATWKTLVLVLLSAVLPLSAADNELDAVDGPNVRVMRHDDGSTSVFVRSPDNRTLTKKTYSANSVLTLFTVYRMDSHGNLLGCKIFSGQRQEFGGQRQELFKVNYGYHRDNGRLEAEYMFDSQVTRRDKDGNEIPVRIVRYAYDAQGNRSAPIVTTTLPGEHAEKVFGKGAGTPTAPKENLFDDRPVNRNARPLR
jgi:hypothetical protein